MVHLKLKQHLKCSLKRKRLPVMVRKVYEYKEAYFNSKTFTILDLDDIIPALNKAAEEIVNSVAVWISGGSGWTIEEVQRDFINLVKYLPLRGSSYTQLPKELRNSMMGLINLQNKDDKCLQWCLVRHLNPRKVHPERITKDDREFAKKLDFSGITFPVTRNQISRIEKQNKININVYGYDTERKICLSNLSNSPP